MDKYIATIETDKGLEVVCVHQTEPLQQIGSLEEIRAFEKQWVKQFPESPVRIYKLKVVPLGR